MQLRYLVNNSENFGNKKYSFLETSDLLNKDRPSFDRYCNRVLVSASFKATRPSQRTSRHIYDLNTFLQLQPIITQRLFPSIHCLMRYSRFFCFIFWEQWLRIFALNSMYNDTHCYLTKHPGTMICTDFSFHYLRVISQELQSLVSNGF